MPTDLTIAAVFGLHVVPGTIVVLSAFAAGSRGLAPGLLTGLTTGGAVIVGDLTIGEELIAVSESGETLLVLTATVGAAVGIVVAALVFEPGTPTVPRQRTTRRPTPTANNELHRHQPTGTIRQLPQPVGPRPHRD